MRTCWECVLNKALPDSESKLKLSEATVLDGSVASLWFIAIPTNNDTDTFFFSASSQIGISTNFVVTCHISSLFLSISVENRLDHVASILKSSCTASGI